MSDVHTTAGPNKFPPTCPRCQGPMELKKVHDASGIEYFFKCEDCAIEYTNPARRNAE
jgi:hypothetical protein